MFIFFKHRADRQGGLVTGCTVSFLVEWQLGVGDEYEAEVMRAVAESVRCGGGPGYLVALRPGASAILCDLDGALKPGDRCRVRVTEVDARSRGVRLERAGREA